MTFNWRKATVGPDASVGDAMRAMDRERLKIALVVDIASVLLGVVTDGDIRRGLLRRVGLEDSVREVMNPKPVVCAPDDSLEKIKQILEERVLLQMPIVDEGVLVDLVTWEQVHNRRRFDNPVFLMAGGLGTRLRPLTDNCPKPLLKVGDKPILETIVERFVAAGFSRFFVALHYLPEMVVEHFGDGSRWGAEIRYLTEDAPLGTAGALGLLPREELSDLPIIVMNGDVLTQVDFEQVLLFHREHESAVTMCVRHYGFQVPYGVVKADGHRVVGITEKPTHDFFVNAGIYVLDREVVDSIRRGAPVDMPDFIDAQIAAGRTVSMFPVHEYWLDIGQKKDFEQAQIDYHRDFS